MHESARVCARSLYWGGFIISRAEGHLALIGVLRCWFRCLQQWSCLLLGIRSWLSPSPSALPLPCSGPSAPRLIPGSLHRYRSALASHQRAKKSSPPFLSFVILFPSYTFFIICSLFFSLLHQLLTHCYLALKR